MENCYERNLEEHVDLVCEQRGRIIDYEVPPVLERRDVAKKTGLEVADGRLEYYGYCRACRKQKEQGG